MDATSEYSKLGDWVERHDETCRGGRRLALLVNCRDGQAIQLDDQELQLLDLLDGTRSRHELLADATACEMLESLGEGGFLAGTASGQPDPATRHGALRRFVDTLDLEWRNADRFVQWTYRSGMRHAFHPTAIAAQAILGVAGAVALAAAITSGHHLHIRAAANHIPLVLTMGLIAVTIHELAHALVAAHNGRHVHSIGFRLHLGTPAFYVDSVEALLLPRRQRLIQAAAGPWAEWLVTSVVALTLWVTPATWLTPLLYRFVILNTLTVTSNLLPFVGLDGHWLLADVIHEPDLARRCHGSIGRLARSIASRRGVERDDLALAAYTVSNTIVAVALVITAAFFWWELFGNLIGHLAHSGPTGWAWLTAATLLLGRPLVLGLTPRVSSACDTIRHLAQRARFRAQHAWRIRATEQLAQHPGLIGLDDHTLSVIAGHLCGGRTIRRTTRLDPNFTGLAITGTLRRVRHNSQSPAFTVACVDNPGHHQLRAPRGGFIATIDHLSLKAITATLSHS